ncbi:hypothetical protein R2233_000808 [Cronobacter turicensis]|nr:hypothetical protein [Cronobacter turicensis]
MSEIKEALAAACAEKVKHLEFAVAQSAFGEVRRELETELAIARVALLALRERAEPEPFCRISAIEKANIDMGIYAIVDIPSRHPTDIPLYTAPPAPVVADDRESFEKFYGSGTTPGLDRVPPWFQEMIKDAFWEVWKGSRAALQQQPVSAPYKLPRKEE